MQDNGQAEKRKAYVKNIRKVLSDSTTYKLFKACTKGLTSGLDTPSKFRLTRKQYYSRLESLEKYDIIRKSDSRYVLTMKGIEIYLRYIEPVEEIVKKMVRDRDRLLFTELGDMILSEYEKLWRQSELLPKPESHSEP